MRDQYEYKFLPDADGNSFSARFRGFLRSSSLPLKAIIYAEWHDDRLAPWLHFVPLDNTFQDLYPALEFFADGDGPGDAAARFIAEQGQRWADRVLRREDMRLYVWRLLLEWARLRPGPPHPGLRRGPAALRALRALRAASIYHAPSYCLPSFALFCFIPFLPGVSGV